ENKIVLRIGVNDAEQPFYTITFPRVSSDSKTGNKIHLAYQAKVEQLHNLIEALINKADFEDDAAEQNGEPKPSLSIEDKLMKLAVLLEKGIITQSELEAIKEKILSQ